MRKIASICFILTGTLLVCPVSVFANTAESEQLTDQEVLERLEQKNILLYPLEEPNEQTTPSTPTSEDESDNEAPPEDEELTQPKGEQTNVIEITPEPTQTKKAKVQVPKKSNQNDVEIKYHVKDTLFFVNASLVDVTESKGVWEITLNGKSITSTKRKEAEAIFLENSLQESHNKLSVHFQGEADDRRINTAKEITFDHQQERQDTLNVNLKTPSKTLPKKASTKSKVKTSAPPKRHEQTPTTHLQNHLISIPVQAWVQQHCK